MHPLAAQISDRLDAVSTPEDLADDVVFLKNLLSQTDIAGVVFASRTRNLQGSRIPIQYIGDGPRTAAISALRVVCTKSSPFVS